MYGYVRPRKDKLSQEQLEAYQAGYCGLCHTLGTRYGLLARFAVSYDMTFLYFLLQAGEQEGTTAKCWCPARPFCKKECRSASDSLDLAAATSLILLHYQLLDHLRDERAFKKIPYWFVKLLLNPAYKKASGQLPELSELARVQMEELWNLEKEKSPSLDRTAHCFAELLRSCAGKGRPEAVQRPMEQLLYHVGRFVYLTDCLDDLEEDEKRQRYNPLRFRFQTAQGKLSEDDLTYVHTLIQHSVSLAGAAYELLPMGTDNSIVGNVIYLGLPTVLQGVLSGEFRRRKRLDL